MQVMGRTRVTGRSLVAATTAVIVLVLAGCGGSSSASGGRTAALNKKSTPQLASAAAKEGRVVWYSTFSSDDLDPMVQAFNKVYPKIKVDALRLSADKLPARVLTEQRGQKFNADVISGDAAQVSQLIQAGALDKFDPPSQAKLPDNIDLPAGYTGVVYVNTTVIAFNPTVLKKKHIAPPTTWADLTKPEWRGNFSVDPGAVNWYEALIQQMGHAKALSLVKALGANQPRLVESHTQAITQVQSGEPFGSVAVYGYKASKLKKETPDTVDFVNTNPLPSAATLIDLAKDSPHPNAARLFLDWMASKQGQQAVVDVSNHATLRTDVANDPAVWDEAKFPPVWSESTVSAARYNREIKEYDAAFHVD
jgi:iron(III) transport system substrate-binding protein